MSGDRPTGSRDGRWSAGRRSDEQKIGVDDGVVDERAVDDRALRRAVVGNATECALVVDDDARIAFAEPAVESVLGHDPSSIVGDGLVTLLPESRRERLAEEFAGAIRTDSVGDEWEERELLARHRDGSEVPVVVSFEPFAHDGHQYYSGVVRDVSDRIDHRQRLQRERAFVESMLDALPDIVYAFDRDGAFLRWNERVNEVTGYTDEEIEGMTPLDFVPEADHERIATEISKVIGNGESRTVETHVVTRDGRRIPYEITGAPLVDGDEIVGQTGVARDITERTRRESRLRRLNELNTVIRSVHRALIDVSTREDIERAVCERLVDVGAYDAVVVGRDDGNSEHVEEAASAGVDVDAVLGTADTSVSTLATEATRTQSVVTTGRLPDDGLTGPDEQAVAAVPLATDDRAFGAFVVVSRHADAFPERERTILTELGRGIGDAIQAAVTRRLLYADVVTEIELSTTDRGLAFVRLSDRADCRIELERSFSFGTDDVFYVSAIGASADRVLALAGADPAFSRTAWVGSDGERALLELVAESGTLTDLVTSHGARTVAAVAKRGRSRVRLELPPDANVRDLVDEITDAYPETSLVARQEVERSLRTPLGYREELTSEMTDKQRAALKAAFSAGYFEWPVRANNAEEVAAMLDIAPQTLHQHLRVALGKLLTAVLDANAGADADDWRA